MPMIAGLTTTRLIRAGLLVLALGVAGCTESTLQVNSGSSGNANAPLPQKVVQTMISRSMARGSPIVARVFKEENKVEIWKQQTNGRYGMLASYEICKMSGKLGPKFIEGDRQSPEGFYTVRPAQMNPNSNYHLAFNIGYPNAYDRAHGRTGSNLMVHGACSSSGCFSMNNVQMTEIYAIARESFKGGQTEFQVQSFPFRMTAANMARYRNDPNYEFWKNLKEGYDYFEITRTPPKVDVCNKRYVFGAPPAAGGTLSPTGACAATEQPDSMKLAYQSYQTGYEAAFASAVKSSDALAPKPTILGIQEAKVVSEWTKKRARGERVPIEPPAMTTAGTVVQTTSRMGRIDSPAGRKMAALEAAEAEKKRIAEEKAAAKRLAEEQKAAAKAAQIAAAEAAKNPPPPPPVETAVAAPAEKPGLLGRMGKRITNMFGG